MAFVNNSLSTIYSADTMWDNLTIITLFINVVIKAENYLQIIIPTKCLSQVYIIVFHNDEITTV